ncbi:MAG: alanine racemase [Succinivibrionaceae bacterium]
METVVAYIDLDALKHNMQLIKEKVHNSKIIGVVKANAYGHGAVECAKAMDQFVCGYAVARIEEALELRANGITKTILMLGGFFREDDLPLIDKYKISFTVHSFYQIEALEKYKAINTLDAWLQLNIGMQRLGFNYDQLIKAKQSLMAIDKVKKPLNFISHLSCADDLATEEYNKKQIALWKKMANECDGELCLANSAGCFYFSETHSDYVRPGIIQYGISPTMGKIGKDFSLNPVMILKSSIIAIREVIPEDVVGYGASWKCSKNTYIGIVAIGYADGYPRSMPNGTPVMINNKIVYTVGRVCMDMMFVDLGSNKDEFHVGDEVELWGRNVSIETIAERVNTIPYELVTRLSKRVKYVFLDSLHKG